MGEGSANFVVRADGAAPVTANKPSRAPVSVDRVNSRYRVHEIQPNCSRSQFVNMSPNRPFSSHQNVFRRNQESLSPMVGSGSRSATN